MAEKLDTKVLDRLRRLCLALPGASETVSFGHPTFRVGKKTFAVMEVYRGEETVAFKASHEAQRMLCQDPRFFVTPYSGKHGWTSLRTKAAKLDWAEVAALIEAAYRAVAPKKLVAQL